MLIQAQTKIIESRHYDKRICLQGMSVTTGIVLTWMSARETIWSTHMVSHFCFASATVLNGLGTTCSVVNMTRRSQRSFDPFAVLLNSLGAGCFWGAKYCQNIGNRTKFI